MVGAGGMGGILNHVAYRKGISFLLLGPTKFSPSSFSLTFGMALAAFRSFFYLTVYFALRNYVIIITSHMWLPFW